MTLEDIKLTEDKKIYQPEPMSVIPDAVVQKEKIVQNGFRSGSDWLK